ncbi:hypothetical protein MY4824_009909 [Beauveria thailandica]
MLNFEDEEAEITLFCLAEGLTGSEASDVWLRLAAPSDQKYYTDDRLDWILKAFNEDEKADPSHSSFLPQRLLHVEGRCARLVDRSGVSSSGRGKATPAYAALSYCWGSAEDAKIQLMTKGDSLTQRQKGISTSQMTAVIRDAVAVTQNLKIPYLWIDSLCILQDDISDWEKQCIDVCDIYANASVTICAASSGSCLQGLLRQRGTRIQIPFSSTLHPATLDKRRLQIEDIFSDEACRGILVYEGKKLGYFELDFAYDSWHNKAWNLTSDAPCSMMDEIERFSMLLSSGGWGEHVTDVRSGLEHALILTSKGRVFAAASSASSYPSKGQMGIPGLSWETRPAGPYDQPQEIKELSGNQITQIAAGDHHSAVLDKTGRIFAFGDNTFGQLGFASDGEPVNYTPDTIAVNQLYAKSGLVANVTSIAAGGVNTYFTVDAARLEGHAVAPVGA